MKSLYLLYVITIVSSVFGCDNSEFFEDFEFNKGITFGRESIAFAAVSSLYCPKDDQLSCLDIGRYNQFKSSYPEPENYALVWALGVLGVNKCIDLTLGEKCPKILLHLEF